VYGGAMIVLAAVAVYLAGYALWVAIAAFALESFLLLLFAIATAYSPNDEFNSTTSAGASEGLLASMNSTVREMTNAVSDLFRLISQSDIRQDVLLTRLTEHLSKTNADTVRQVGDKIDETNNLLRLFLETTYQNQVEIARQNAAALQETRRTLDQLVDRLNSTTSSAGQGAATREMA
jgi:hypothetical protein